MRAFSPRKRFALAALALPVALALAAPTTVSAQSDLVGRLRQALRDATRQIRSLEDERAALQARQGELERQLEEVAGEAAKQDAEALAKCEAKYDAAIEEFNERLKEEREQVLRAIDALEQWKQAYEEAADLARSKERARKELEGQLRVATERVGLCEISNRQLFVVGSEILEQLANFGVADALAVREPLLGLKRVELQKVVQDYEDKLLDNRMLPQ